MGFHILLDDEDIVEREKDTPEEFYDKMRAAKGIPSTAASSVASSAAAGSAAASGDTYTCLLYTSVRERLQCHAEHDVKGCDHAAAGQFTDGKILIFHSITPEV